MTNLQTSTTEIKNVVTFAHPIPENCKKCGQGIAVTTEDYCGICDQEVNEWPTSK